MYPNFKFCGNIRTKIHWNVLDENRENITSCVQSKENCLEGKSCTDVGAKGIKIELQAIEMPGTKNCCKAVNSHHQTNCRKLFERIAKDNENFRVYSKMITYFQQECKTLEDRIKWMKQWSKLKDKFFRIKIDSCKDELEEMLKEKKLLKRARIFEKQRQKDELLKKASKSERRIIDKEICKMSWENKTGRNGKSSDGCTCDFFSESESEISEGSHGSVCGCCVERNVELKKNVKRKGSGKRKGICALKGQNSFKSSRKQSVGRRKLRGKNTMRRRNDKEKDVSFSVFCKEMLKNKSDRKRTCGKRKRSRLVEEKKRGKNLECRCLSCKTCCKEKEVEQNENKGGVVIRQRSEKTVLSKVNAEGVDSYASDESDLYQGIRLQVDKVYVGVSDDKQEPERLNKEEEVVCQGRNEEEEEYVMNVNDEGVGRDSVQDVSSNQIEMEISEHTDLCRDGSENNEETNEGPENTTMNEMEDNKEEDMECGDSCKAGTSSSRNSEADVRKQSEEEEDMEVSIETHIGFQTIPEISTCNASSGASQDETQAVGGVLVSAGGQLETEDTVVDQVVAEVVVEVANMSECANTVVQEDKLFDIAEVQN